MCFSTHTRNKGLPYCTPTWELRWDRVEVGVHCLTVVAFHCVTYDYAVERPPQTGCVMLIMGTGGSFCCCCGYNGQINALKCISARLSFFNVLCIFDVRRSLVWCLCMALPRNHLLIKKCGTTVMCLSFVLII